MLTGGTAPAVHMRLPCRFRSGTMLFSISKPPIKDTESALHDETALVDAEYPLDNLGLPDGIVIGDNISDLVTCRRPHQRHITGVKARQSQAFSINIQIIGLSDHFFMGQGVAAVSPTATTFNSFT